MSAANLDRARCVQISEADLHSIFCEEMKKDNLLLFAKKTTEETRGVLPKAARVGPHGTGAFLLGYVLQIWARRCLPLIGGGIPLSLLLTTYLCRRCSTAILCSKQVLLTLRLDRRASYPTFVGLHRGMI